MSLRIAIVGSGPSGLYAAVDLLKRAPSAQVELFDRLPTIGGLVRSGVSPDHAARRQVSATYERIAMASGRFRFRGNVEIGRDLPHADLAAHHHAVVYASGASSDRALGIPGEDLAGSHAATQFVGWYNGHPDFAHLTFDLSAERAVVVGNGNVALDVARMLLLPVDDLRATDVADHALTALANSRVREVVILGRRGPAQAAFTAPELLELGGLPDVDVVVDGAEWPAPTPSDSLRLRLLREFAQAPSRGHAKRLVLRFLASPLAITGERCVDGVRIVHNTLVADGHGELRARTTDRTGTIPCGLVFRSIGYRAPPLAGLPFDETLGVLPNRDGRVLDPATGAPLPGVYVCGWLKRGPSGVIGTNKHCSQDTVARLLEDAAAGRLPAPRATGDLDALLAARNADVVDYRAWKRIDRREQRLGAEQGRPRIKLAHRDDLLLAARG